VSIDYPKGLKHVDKILKETFYVYEGSVDIVATVKRAANDTGPLAVTVKYVICNDKECKPPETVKLDVK
jgi:Disulphide bond corrector protein DsbC